MNRSPILLACAVALTAQAQTISFLSPKTALSAIRYPFPLNSLAAGDFNHDGKLDLVSVSIPDVFGNTPLTVLPGNGDGSFQLAKTIMPTGAVNSPVVADFDGDGNLDVAVSIGATIVALLGNGDGSFRAPIATTLPAGTAKILAADLNRDGHPDIIAGQTILLGNGDGTFRVLPAALDAPAFLAADFNNDGTPDLLLVSASGRLTVALGVGDGTFGNALPVNAPFPPGSYAVGDFNGDGFIDLAVSPAKIGACVLNCSNPIAAIAVLAGKGDGTFQQTPIMTSNSMGPIWAAADMNRDGELDLVVGNSVMAGNGDGTFRFPVFFGLTKTKCGADACQVWANFASVSVADFNGDRALDIATSLSFYDFPGGEFPDEEVSILLNDSPGDGFFVTGVSSPTYIWPTGAISIATAFGVNLAPSTASASNAASPPTTLGGIRVHLLDRVTQTDQLAPLYYVSPTQINFEVSTADTFVYVGIEQVGSPYAPKGIVIPVQTLQPDLFDAATTVQTGGSLYLSLYGTGFNSAPTSCAIAGVSVPITYSGPQLQIPGLDQVNLQVPSSLAGAGQTTARCSFGSATTNPVHITIP